VVLGGSMVIIVRSVALRAFALSLGQFYLFSLISMARKGDPGLKPRSGKSFSQG
jgi:hypothetical protein